MARTLEHQPILMESSLKAPMLGIGPSMVLKLSEDHKDNFKRTIRTIRTQKHLMTSMWTATWITSVHEYIPAAVLIVSSFPSTKTREFLLRDLGFHFLGCCVVSLVDWREFSNQDVLVGKLCHLWWLSPLTSELLHGPDCHSVVVVVVHQTYLVFRL